MGFKLGNKPYTRDFKTRGVELNIVRKSLPDGVHGETIDGDTIAIDKDIPNNSSFFKHVKDHESTHAREMKSGRLDFGDDWVRSDGKTYPRKDGKIKYNGTWYEEGDKNLPWEKRAMV